jgi:hypothetical protein
MTFTITACNDASKGKINRLNLKLGEIGVKGKFWG